jgi:recombination protein RecT
MTAVATRPSVKDFKVDLTKLGNDIAQVAYRGFTAERLLAECVEAATKEPKILEAHPRSVYLALMKCARWGLDIGDGVYLVPLNSKNGMTVEAWPSYHGLKALAIRQGLVRGMDEFPVYSGDEFEYELGLDARLRHVPASSAKRGELRGAYTIIRLPGGVKTFHYLPIEDIEVTRANSRSWGPTQVKGCPPWYAMKTVVRDWLSRQPKAGALADALEVDDTVQARPANVDEDGVVIGRGTPDGPNDGAPFANGPDTRF